MGVKHSSRRRAREKFWEEHDRDNYTCPDCGRGRSEIRKDFEVHHQDGDPTNNTLSNLIGLCQACHNLREGKKPSLSEIQYLRDQYTNTTEAISLPDTPPIVTNHEDYAKYQEQCAERYLPGLNINRIGSRKYAKVEFDFILVEGWKVIETPGAPDLGVGATLSEDAADTCQRILDKYRDDIHQQAFHTMTIKSGQCFFTTPKLPLKAAKTLAYELDGVVNDRSNWILTESSARKLNEDGVRIRLADRLKKQ